ncbi:MAG TPA: hypothetical protein VEI50_01325 [Nitrospiraceae bacterium]|jgi:hypothetical protein|nr:hypothetical protein [Nitrospiraceae bacterium]
MNIDVKRLLALALMAGIIGGFGTGLALADSDEAASSNAQSMQMDTAPGPAFTTVDGKISKIDGPVYTVQSESTGYQNLGSTKNVNEVKIYVSKETKKLHGEKKVGDKIRAEVTQGGFANSIQ